MFQAPHAPPPAPPLPVAEDQHIDADLDVALRTPSTLVVMARLELVPGTTGRRSMDLGLVIPRSQCRGDRPLLAALLEATRAAVERATRNGNQYIKIGRPRRVLTLVAGRPHLIPLFDSV
jgi:hypothetical protein